MAIAHVSASSGFGDSSSSSVTSISTSTLTAIPAGSAVCVALECGLSQSTFSIADNKTGNSYSAVTSAWNGVNGFLSLFVGINIQNGPTVLTGTIGTAASYVRIFVDTFTGIATTSALDGNSTINYQSAPGTGTNAITSGTFTAAFSGDLIWGVTLSNSALSVGTGFTQGLHDSSAVMLSEYNLSGSSGSNAATFTGSSADASTTGAFALKAAAAPATCPSMSLLSIGCGISMIGWTPALLRSPIPLIGGAALRHVRNLRRKPAVSRRELFIYHNGVPKADD